MTSPSFQSIFREIKALSEHGTTPIEFVIPKSSFTQKKNWPGLRPCRNPPKSKRRVSVDPSPGWTQTRDYARLAENEKYENLNINFENLHFPKIMRGIHS